jgi:hypothetical protein
MDPHPVSELTTSMSEQPQPSIEFSDFPPEIRLEIYPHALAMGWGASAPNLLVALAKEPDLFKEAKEVYLKINAKIHDRNRVAYSSIHLKTKEGSKLKHLLLSCTSAPYVPLLVELGKALLPTSDGEKPPTNLSFSSRNQRCSHTLTGSLLKLRNNLSTISLDMTACPRFQHNTETGLGSTGELSRIAELDNASSCLTRVAIRMHSVEKMLRPGYTDTQKETFREIRRAFIEYANRRFGVKGRLEQIPDESQCPDSWFWEAMDNKGGQLKITPN